MRVLVLRVPRSEADVAAARLWAAGATAIEEREGEVTDLITVLAADDDISSARLGEVPDHWEVGFADHDDAPSEAWRDHAHPIVVNPHLVIQPAWIPNGDSDAHMVVTIEPGAAFGLGDHPTTRMSADAAWRLTEQGDEVLDVGSGSGVLAIVSLRRDARAAVAIDVADAAREATLDNAVRNGVADRLTASCTPISEVGGAFDLVFANILAPTLIALADDLVRLVRPGGRLVVSGVLADHHDHVVDALVELDITTITVQDAWACIELVKPLG